LCVSLLTGFASWLIASEPPTWFAYPDWWITILLGVGFGLVPIWWQLAFATQDNAQ